MTDIPDAPRPPPSPGPQPAPAPEPAPLPDAGPPAPAKRPLLKRLFGIGFWGSMKLLALCIVVGFFLMAANFDASEPSFDFIEALRAMLRQAFAALGWAITNFWQPALAGAVIVLPLWALWRLASLPWRK